MAPVRAYRRGTAVHSLVTTDEHIFLCGTPTTSKPWTTPTTSQTSQGGGGGKGKRSRVRSAARCLWGTASTDLAARCDRPVPHALALRCVRQHRLLGSEPTLPRRHGSCRCADGAGLGPVPRPQGPVGHLPSADAEPPLGDRRHAARGQAMQGGRSSQQDPRVLPAHKGHLAVEGRVAAGVPPSQVSKLPGAFPSVSWILCSAETTGGYDSDAHILVGVGWGVGWSWR